LIEARGGRRPRSACSKKPPAGGLVFVREASGCPDRLDEGLHSEDRARRKPKRSRGRAAVSDKTGTLTIGVAASSET